MGIRVRPKTITEKQLNLQVQLNTIHENIREILIRNRTTSARLIKIENYYRIYFISMELAIATSFDHNKLHQKFDNHPRVLATYQN
jgi:hypothetical protein